MAKIMKGKQTPVQPMKQSLRDAIMNDKSFIDGIKNGAGYALATTLVTAAINAAAKAIVNRGGDN